MLLVLVRQPLLLGFAAWVDAGVAARPREREEPRKAPLVAARAGEWRFRVRDRLRVLALLAATLLRVDTYPPVVRLLLPTLGVTVVARLLATKCRLC